MNKNNPEEIYIRKRKKKAYIIKLIYNLFRIFPIHKKKIVFTTFEGDGGYCCNPRYIAEQILQSNKQYELIWLVNDTAKKFPKGICKVKNSFLNRVYHLATAKVWIDNSRKEYGTIKRKGQLYIQTWHGAIEFKPVGKFRGKLFPKIAYLVSKHDSKLIDYVLSNSLWCTKNYPKMLLYDGKIIKTGSPRCDIFFTKRKKLYKQIRNRYKIPQDAKIVMFAPTFRGGGQKGARQVFRDEPTLDFNLLTKSLEERFGGVWYVFLRLHPQLGAQFKNMPVENKTKYMKDVTQADDINEIMAATDVLITDYSSSAFDAINMYIPVFLYVDDFEEYIRDRGKLMWDIDKLPFSSARTNEELQKKILSFNEDRYKNEVYMFLEENKVLEDGCASSRVLELLESFIEEDIKFVRK